MASCYNALHPSVEAAMSPVFIAFVFVVSVAALLFAVANFALLRWYFVTDSYKRRDWLFQSIAFNIGALVWLTVASFLTPFLNLR